jgi:hypothetical protein
VPTVRDIFSALVSGLVKAVATDAVGPGRHIQ